MPFIYIARYLAGKKSLLEIRQEMDCKSYTAKYMYVKYNIYGFAIFQSTEN